MADTLIKMKTGTISKLESKNSNGTPQVALDKGSVYFAVDTTNHLGKIVYDAPSGANGVDRIVMSTRAEYADEANIAQTVGGVIGVDHGGTGQTSIADIQAGKDGDGNTITSTYATKSELNNLIAAADAMVFKGVVDSTHALPNAPYNAGWTYKVGAFDTYAGKICEVGDLIICVKDRASGATVSDDDWIVVQTNLDNGLFKGSNTFTDGEMLLADGTVGKVKSVSINPVINMTNGTSSAAPKFTITVGGQTSSSVSIGTAATNAYGVTKLSDSTASTSTSLAATANAVKQAYDLAASKTDNVGTITGVTAGAGLTGGGTSGNVTLGHSNSTTAITTEGLYKIKWDAQGHITGALSQNVTDNSSNADVTNTDTNLITARTLYYQLAKKGYTTNTGTVTKVSTSDGITGGDITTTGTIKHAVPTGASATTYGTSNSRKYIQTVTTDKFGHITGITTGTETVTNSDTKVNVVARGTTKAYLLADTTAPTSTAAAHTAVAETGVYLDTTAGKLVATSFSGSGASLTSLDASNISSGTLNVERLPASEVQPGMYQGITVDSYGRVTGAVDQGYSKLTIGTTATTAAAGNHTHTTSLASDTGTTDVVSLTSGGTFKLTTGGTSVLFKMPVSNNYSHPTTTAATAAAVKVGKDSLGHVVIGAALAKGDVGLGNVTNDAQIPKSIGTAKGDIIYFSASGTPARLAVGTNGQVLKVNSSGIPAWASDTDTDTKVTNTLGTTTKYYIAGTTSTSTNTGTQTFDTGVYVTTTAGELNAKQYKVDEAVTLQYNSTTKSLDFIFA